MIRLNKQKNEYYVYEWIRLDTNEPFYVGKGKGKRAFDFNNRNKYFQCVIKNRDVAVVILEDNLTEDLAFEYEIFYIEEYFNMGYSLTNITQGGEGVSGWYANLDNQSKENYSKNMTRILNERYKNNEELKKQISSSCKKTYSNPTVKERCRELGKLRHEKDDEYFKRISHDYWYGEETKEIAKKKASEHTKKLWNNEEIRNKIIHTRKNSELVKRKHEEHSKLMKGGGNSNAKKVQLKINGNIYSFDCKKDARKFLEDNNYHPINEKRNIPIKKITNELFNKKFTKEPIVDFYGNTICLI